MAHKGDVSAVENPAIEPDKPNKLITFLISTLPPGTN